MSDHDQPDGLDLPDRIAIREALTARRPRQVRLPKPGAAVALIMRGEVDTEVLFIERSARPGDRWSGQMALPGGRVEKGDASLEETAARETLEEVGLDLFASSRTEGALARLDDQSPSTAGSMRLSIAAFAWQISGDPELTFSEEVASAHWVALSRLIDPERRVSYRYPLMPVSTFPGILVGEPDRHVVWGLTYRIISDFLRVLDLRVGG